MSVILTIDNGDHYSILADSCRKYNGLAVNVPGKKVYRYGSLLVANVGCCSKGEVWHRAAREIHKELWDGGKNDYYYSDDNNRRVRSNYVIEKIIDRASEVGFDLYRDFDFGCSRFIKIKGKIFYVESAFYEEVKDTYMAIGSGRKYVYGAMDSNQVDPRVAMKIACRRDPSCALPITQMRVYKNDGSIHDDGEV